MIFVRRIKIKNFKQYKDLELEFDPRPGLFLFVGRNKIGKSNFLNAVCWCLYDKLPFIESLNENDPAVTLLNRDTRVNVGPYEEVSVEFEIQSGNKYYLFKRTQRESQDSKFIVMIRDGNSNNYNPVPTPLNIRDSFLPESLQKYFIFHGENVSKFFTGSDSKYLKEGIWKVSNIEVLDRALDNIEKLFIENRRQISNENPEIDKLQKETENIIKNIESKKKDIQNIIDEIPKLVNDKKELEAKQRSMAKIKELIDHRKTLESKLEYQRDLDKEKATSINDIIIKNAPFFYLNEVFNKIIDKVDIEKKTGRIPPKIAEKFINDIIKDRQCICGRDIKKGTKEYDCLKKLKEESVSSDKRSILLDDVPRMHLIIDRLPEIVEQINVDRADRANIMNSCLQAERKLAEIKRELESSEDQKISDLENMITRLEKTIRDYEIEKTTKLKDIEELEEEYKILDQKIKLFIDNEKIQKSIKDRLNIIEETKDHLEYVRARITNRIRNLLSKNTESNFKKLFWEEGLFSQIEFTEDYVLDAKLSADGSRETEFSTGLQKVFGLATLQAIADLSGFKEVPIFYDAPLSDLDPGVAENFLDSLPKLVESKQVFIFSVNSGELESFIKKNVKKENLFRLIKDDENPQSVIISK